MRYVTVVAGAVVALMLASGAYAGPHKGPFYRQQGFWARIALIGAATAADYVTTRQAINRGAHEENPLLGSHPSNANLVELGTAVTFGSAFAATKAGEGGTRTARIVSWLVPAAIAGVHVELAVHNAGVCPGNGGGCR